MTTRSSIILKSELADTLNALHRARPDLAEGFNLVRVSYSLRDSKPRIYNDCKCLLRNWQQEYPVCHENTDNPDTCIRCGHKRECHAYSKDVNGNVIQLDA